MRSSFRNVALALAAAVATVFVSGLAACGGPAPALTIGMESTAVNSLVYIAEGKGYFASNNLDVVVKEYPSGKAAVDGLLNNEVDVATASEFVIAARALSGEGVSTLATIDEFLHIYLLARRDRGITQPLDLPGKRIGVPLKTMAEFSLGRFLEIAGLDLSQVTLVDVPPAESAAALTGAEVDAVITWRPYVNHVEDQLGDGIVAWQAQSEQAAFCALTSRGEWVAEHGDEIEELLEALLEAQDYATAHPDAARAIVQSALGYDDAYMASVWPEHYLTVSLSQPLVAALEDEARWMIAHDLTTAEQIPDFLDSIYVEGLASVRPRAVDVVR